MKSSEQSVSLYEWICVMIIIETRKKSDEGERLERLTVERERMDESGRGEKRKKEMKRKENRSNERAHERRESNKENYNASRVPAMRLFK